MKTLLPLAAVLSLGTLFTIAHADDDYIPPVTDATTISECGSCHLPFPPSLLPTRSWMAIMGSLDDHFGENAELDEATRSDIEAYLVANAADAGNRRFRGAPENETPLRITALHWFVDEHRREVSSRMLDKAGSMSNCTACHRGAERGNFDDD